MATPSGNHYPRTRRALIIYLFGVETAREMGVDEDLIDRVTKVGTWSISHARSKRPADAGMSPVSGGV
jgi:hypothetical protein